MHTDTIVDMVCASLAVLSCDQTDQVLPSLVHSPDSLLWEC